MRLSLLIGGCLLAALVLAGSAAAQSPYYPPADSPSGAIYEIPLEGARRDAAPHDSGGSGRSGGSVRAGTLARGADPGASAYRSENNFGSSSEVPGLAPARASARGADRDRKGGRRQTAGTAAAGDAAGAAATYARRGALLGSSTEAEQPSATGLGFMLVVLLLAALLTATLAARSRRRSG